MKLYILIFLSLLAAQVNAQLTISGRVISASDKTGLPGSTVKLLGAGSGISTDKSGYFKLTVPGNTQLSLRISFVGFVTCDTTISLPLEKPLEIALHEDATALKEVVVSTGYQDVSKVRATGSFVKVDNELLNRRVSTDVLTRIEDVAPGLIFNRGKGAGTNDISIRGRASISAATSRPLIVLDNFPYEADLSTINPNDVESITILKDAAAASIWGARAGNGVIVITTKKAGYNRPLRVSFNSNITLGEKPDLFYQPVMSAADFIEVEKSLFSKNYYKSRETSVSKAPLTPVVELLIAKRDGRLSAEDADARIEALKEQDIRNDFKKYFYRQRVNRQYSFSLNGGNEIQNYFISAGYDKNTESLVGNDFSRFTFNASNTFSLLKNRLELRAGILYSQTKEIADNPGTGAGVIYMISPSSSFQLPYARLADENGNPLAVVKNYRDSFIESTAQTGLLNWEYKPLEEISLADNKDRSTDYRLNAALKYKIADGLNAEIIYQYSRHIDDTRNFRSEQTYYTRDLINKYSIVNASGSIERPVPLGGVLDQTNASGYGYNIRPQISYGKDWHSTHRLDVLAGYEERKQEDQSNVYRLYGYDDVHASSTAVDYVNFYKMYYYPGSTAKIPYIDSNTGLSDRNRSYYANAAYSYLGRYTLSGSGRLDRSNLFGVNTNQKGVPLWSAGFAWNASDEDFYSMTWLPYLKLRATYGYNGNVDKSLSAYTTAYYYSNDPNTQLPYATIQNPPNPELRWEKIKIVNLGLDFQSRNAVFSGTVEYYLKKGIDLIGTTPYAPSTGITTFTGNYANTRGNGVDVNLTARIFDRKFKWYTDFLFSVAKDKVTHYDIQAEKSSYLSLADGGGVYPIEGKPLFSVYSYRWAGLDPETGDPQGYVNGEVSKDYAAIASSSTVDDLVYNGPARPTVFGSFRNTFSWRNITLSANITYRLGYYFKRASVNYTTVLRGEGGHGDYALRWQKKGDELYTQVPSMPAVNNVNRNNFYANAEQLVEKGDHIRLQDINLSYNLNERLLKQSSLRLAQVYVYANNAGIIWKRYSGKLDPDYAVAAAPPAFTLAAGIKVEF